MNKPGVVSPFDLLKFLAAHPEHVATIMKVIGVLSADPSLIPDILKLVQGAAPPPTV